jgi:hypothetical protein
MAFEWLVTPDNRIEVKARIKDRNEDIIEEVTIGYGYGLFRGQNQLEYIGQSSASFSHVGTLVFYEPLGVHSVTVNGKEYNISHIYPSINDVCVWRGVSYTITGVDPHPDVHGDLVGYSVRCSTGHDIR